MMAAFLASLTCSIINEAFITEYDAVEVWKVQLVGGGAGAYAKRKSVLGQNLMEDLYGDLFDRFDDFYGGHFVDGQYFRRLI